MNGKIDLEFIHNGANYFCKQKVYCCQIYDDNKLVRNLIPCCCNTNVNDKTDKKCQKGTSGLYDTVEGKFYTNQGDKTKGDFIPGPEVN